MTPNLDQLADRVWEQTRPTLRRRRRTRRAVLGSGALGAVALLAALSLPGPQPEPASPSLAAPASSASPTAPDHSLAVLIIDSSGARFAQLRSEEIASHGLSPNFDLAPVVASPLEELSY